MPAAGCGSESISSAARFVGGTATSPIASCGHEHRAARDDHLRAVGHVDDEVAADDVDIRQLDAGGQIDDALAGGRGGDLADVDRQRASMSVAPCASASV